MTGLRRRRRRLGWLVATTSYCFLLPSQDKAPAAVTHGSEREQWRNQSVGSSGVCPCPVVTPAQPSCCCCCGGGW